jgi:hypothetical protein
MDELIEGVRILKGREPDRTGIHAEEARNEYKRTRSEAVQDAGQQEPPAAEHGEIGRGRNRPDNVRSMSEGYGNSVAYVVARIKGVRPDIGERIGKGEFKSARAAAREAGMVGESAAVIFQGETAAWLKAEARRRGVKVAHLARDIIGAYRARGGM